MNGDGYADLGVAVEWTSTQQIKNHQFYAFPGGSPFPTAPSTTIPVTLNALR